MSPRPTSSQLRDLRQLSELTPADFEAWLDEPQLGETKSVELFAAHTGDELPRSIGTAELVAVETPAGIAFTSVRSVELTEPVSVEELTAALARRHSSELDDAITRTLVAAIVDGIDPATMSAIRDPKDRPRRSEELLAAAHIYRLVVDVYGRRDPVEWVAKVLGCSRATAGRRIAEARKRELLPPATIGIPAKSATTKRGKR